MILSANKTNPVYAHTMSTTDFDAEKREIMTIQHQNANWGRLQYALRIIESGKDPTYL